MSLFKQIVVIGYGVVTGRVLSYVNEYASKKGYTVQYIEHEIYPFNMAKKYAEAHRVDYQVIPDKIQLTQFFLNQADKGRLLIISASNNYLFPKQLVENKNVTIVNFHNALLPQLPGRNAPSWAIFEKYVVTGITWHYVSSGIDDGDIIIQKQCPITQDMKAYELVSCQMTLAGDAFEEVFDDIILGNVKPIKQKICDRRKIYKSNEVPGGGMFNLNDDIEYIYRLLRAMDYGKNSIFPLPTTIYNGNPIIIKRYKKIAVKDKRESANKLYIPFNNEELLMLKYEQIC